MNTVSVSRPFEYLRLTSLGVIGALVKVDDHEVIGFLLQTEIISLCLRIMEMGSELSKTVRINITHIDIASIPLVIDGGRTLYVSVNYHHICVIESS